MEDASKNMKKNKGDSIGKITQGTPRAHRTNN